MLQNKLFKHLFILILLCASQVALAAPFSVTWNSTIGAGSTLPYIIGESVSITFVLDNGGASTISQTWNAADVVSVTFLINDAPNTITTVFDPNSGDGIDFATGSFQTDASGVLIAAPSSWSDNVTGGMYVTSDDPEGTTDFRWWVNGGNEILVNDSAELVGAAIWADPVDTNINPAFWSFVGGEAGAYVSVPTLSNWALILMSLLLAFIGLTRVRRQF